MAEKTVEGRSDGGADGRADDGANGGANGGVEGTSGTATEGMSGGGDGAGDGTDESGDTGEGGTSGFTADVPAYAPAHAPAHGSGDAARPVRIADGYFPVETLGPGRRLAVWFQGCALACPGCMSRHTWNPSGGRTVTVGELLRLWDAALARGAEGLTVSGGEPLAQPAALAALLRGADRLRRRHDGRRHADLLVYTGHEPDEVPAGVWSALTGADAVVTGRFRVAEPTDLVWRGSANQRLVPRTALGARRYGPHLSRTYPPGPRVSLRPEPAGPGPGTGARVYGVPARGELRRLEHDLAAGGILLRGPSWRT